MEVNLGLVKVSLMLARVTITLGLAYNRNFFKISYSATPAINYRYYCKC